MKQNYHTQLKRKLPFTVFNPPHCQIQLQILQGDVGAVWTGIHHADVDAFVAGQNLILFNVYLSQEVCCKKITMLKG